MILAALFVLTAGALTPAEAESKASLHVTREFERVGRAAPLADPRLAAAAKALAEHAVATSASEAADLRRVTEQISAAEAYDASPRSMLIRGFPLEATVESLLSRTDLNEDPASHFGVGVAVGKDHAALVLVFAERKVKLLPFPRRLRRVGMRAQLCGELLPPLATAEVYVTAPDGKVEKLPLSRKEGPEFCAWVRFPSAGRYTVEVIGRGDRGPEVAALFFSDAGPLPRRSEDEPLEKEPTTVEAARAEVLAKINALRAAHGAAPLTPDPKLTELAQAYSDQMSRDGFFAHVAPDGTDLRTRLERGGYVHRLAGENLGLASGPLSAHFGIEQSPGHRRNLLEPVYSAAGIGVTFEGTGPKQRVLLTEILADPGKQTLDPLADAYKALAERRAALKLPALRRSEVLERLAVEHVKRALELDSPKGELPGPPLHDRVFDAMTDIGGTATDVFIGETPAALPSSKNIANRHHSQVGIGAVRGDSPRFGKGKYWIVVIYTSPAQ